MIDRFEILASKIRHLVSRNRWSAKLLGYQPVMGHGDEPGIVMIQIDGLGEEVFRQALQEGKMPFTRHLIEDERYGLHKLYSGMVSNTPGFQGEFFYGVKTVVPGFGFRDRELGRAVAMNYPSAAAAVEARLRRRGPGLLRGGSSWSDVFSGEAAESHFCPATAGLDAVLRALNPMRALGLVVWHGWSVVRVVANLVAETGLAVWDFVRGALEGRFILQELRFVPERVVVTAVLREIVTAGACIDAERGLPVVHVNFLGYDEHAHRRGPRSGFALWTLRGIDRAIKRIWLAAHRSRHRDYQVWVYSDHGQEPVVSYPEREGEDVSRAILRAYRRLSRQESRAAAAIEEGSGARASIAGARGGQQSRRGWSRTPERPERSRWIGHDLPDWVRAPGMREAREASPPAPPRGELEVIHKGPVGFVYVPEGIERGRVEALGAALAVEAGVPTVMIDSGDGGASVWVRGGRRLRLPEDAPAVFGEDHPFLPEVTEDTLRVVRHPDAGSLVIMGWDLEEPLSFKVESGAHGGPGPRETGAFLVVPPEMEPIVPRARPLRPLDMRELARRVLDAERAHIPLTVAAPGARRGEEPAPAPVCAPTRMALRVMTYNVHGCRGMDGRFSTQRIARVIARARPDVICLQELDRSRTRSGGADQIHEIAAALRADYHFHPVAEVDDGVFGNAILSPHPMRPVRRGALPGLTGRLRLAARGALWVEVDVGGYSVQVLNTHLSIWQPERRMQTEALLSKEWLRHPDCRAPVVLAGDFNASTISWTARRLGAMLRSAGPAVELVPLRTWSSRIPVRRIDHVFSTEDLEVRAIHVPRSRLARVASDHLPLVVDLVCRDAPGEYSEPDAGRGQRGGAPGDSAGAPCPPA